MQDAMRSTRLLPVLLSPSLLQKKKLILGRNLDVMLQGKIAGDPSVADRHLLGDLGLFKKLRQEDTNNLKEKRVWRLLIERGGWIYLFPTLPKNAGADEHPPVLAIEKGGESLIILSPDLRETN